MARKEEKPKGRPRDNRPGKGNAGGDTTPAVAAAKTTPVDPGTPIKNPSQVINTSYAIQPNQYTEFGNQTIAIDPATGRPIVTTAASGQNKDVLTGLQSGAIGANNQLNALLNQPGFLNSVNVADPSQQLQQSEAYQKALYGQLTKGFGDQRRQDEAALEQSLANRGIPVGSELYNNQRKQLANRYDDMQQNAWNQSVTGGAQLGLQGSQLGLQGSQLKLNAVPTLAGVGQGGFFQPNYAPYQQVDPTDLFNIITGKNIAKQNNETDLDIARIQADAAKSAAAASGGGGNQVGSPFGGAGPSTGAKTMIGQQNPAQLFQQLQPQQQNRMIGYAPGQQQAAPGQMPQRLPTGFNPGQPPGRMYG